MQEVDKFFEANYNSLARYCRAKWNGSGRDVLHQAYVIARTRYKHINFSLFVTICDESIRNQDMHLYAHDDNGTIILPPTKKAAERLMKETEEDEHVKKLTKIARKMAREHKTGQMCLFLAGQFGQEVRG